MRIDALSQISKLYRTNSTKKLNSADKSGKTDKLEISQIGRDYQIAKKAIEAAPDVREDKIAEIAEAMASGTYNVSDEQIADKIAGNYFVSFF